MATVFIAHAGADAQAALRIAISLKRAHHQVWIDKWEIHVGTSIIEAMNRGLHRSHNLILCLSDQNRSAWVDREWMSTLAAKLAGDDILLIPVMLANGRLPAIIRDVKYVDASTSWSTAMADLRSVLAGRP